MSYPWNRAIVVGASSGIGEAMAKELAANGTRVALVARRGEELARIVAEIESSGGEARAHPHDVRDLAGTPSLFQEITTELGGLDLIAYSAGILPRIGPDEFPSEIDATTIETNLVGAVAWLNEAAGRFGRAGSGTIIGISSVAGDRGRVGNPVYNASKAGLDTYLEALRNRLARKGITVLTAKPGYVRTPMLEGAPVPPFVPVLPPGQTAHQILDAAQAGRRLAYIPEWWRWIMLLVRLTPAPIFERLRV